MELRRQNDWKVVISPWPFDVGDLALDVPFRRLPAAQYENEDSFRAAFHDAPVEHERVMVEAV